MTREDEKFTVAARTEQNDDDNEARRKEGKARGKKNIKVHV